MQKEIPPTSTEVPGTSSGWCVRSSIADSRRWLLLVLPTAALVVIVIVDLILARRPWPLIIDGPVDEVGHLLTAVLLLAAFLPPLRRRIWPWALLGAVAIDIDHVPLYTFAPEFSSDGRPPTHSLSTALVVGLFAVIPALRIPCAGLALGICLHFVRDLATGPGVPLFWPVYDGAIRIQYPVYLGVLCGATALATWRAFHLTRANPGSAGSRPAPLTRR